MANDEETNKPTEERDHYRINPGNLFNGDLAHEFVPAFVVTIFPTDKFVHLTRAVVIDNIVTIALNLLR